MTLIHRSTDKQFYFTIWAENGEIIATSETYKQKANCIKGIAAICRQIKGEVLVQDMTTNRLDKTFKVNARGRI